MIKFLDLHKMNARFEQEFKTVFSCFLNSGTYVLGGGVQTFEEEYAAFCETKHCVGVSSGLDALVLIFKGYIQLGLLKKGDEVIVPATTFIASVLAILEADLKPVFAEPDPVTFNVTASTLEGLITSKTKAILMVHLYGQLCSVEGINRLAVKNNLLVIEDAAQAHGATNNKGLKAGALADAAAFSFYPAKNFGALGDGGAVTTNNSALAEVVKKIRNYGSVSKYENDILGSNNRLDEIQALFLSVKLKTLASDNLTRQTIAKRYISEVKNDKIKLPFYKGGDNHVFHLFVVLVESRTDFIAYLTANGVQSSIHYPKPPHKQKALTQFNTLELPITSYIHDRCVSLPISPVMSRMDIDTVIKVLNRY